MPALPLKLRAYILAHLPVVMLLLLLVFRQPRPVDWNWPLVVGMMALAVVLSTWRVELTIWEAKMTLTFALVSLALLLQGIQAAILCSLLGALVSSYFRPVKDNWLVERCSIPSHRVLFNVANCMVACCASTLVFDAVRALAPAGDLGVVLALVAFTGSFFLINTAGVAVAVAMSQGRPWFEIWQREFVWTAPGFFASASAAAAIYGLYDRAGLWSFLFLPPLYVVYYSFRLYMERLRAFAAKVQQDMLRIQELNQLNQAIIASLATAIDAKDRYSCSQVNRIRIYAEKLADAAGVTGPDREAILTGALVHDIGKLGVPDHVLGKAGKLTPDEFARIRSHVSIGAAILAPIPFPFPVLGVVLTHHERWDGLGYPRGLKGERIPIGGRIIAIADVFDAITSNRPYRRARSHQEALQILREGAGKAFDPRLIELFEQVLPEAWEEVRRLESETLGSEVAGDEDGYGALIRIGQAAAEMAAVCDVAHALAEQESLEGVAGVVAERALSLLPVETAVLYFRDPHQPVLRAAAVAGRHAERLREHTVTLGGGLAGRVAECRQPLINEGDLGDLAPCFVPGEAPDLCAASAVPLGPGPDNPGVLAVYAAELSSLSEHHLNVLNILAEHTTTAVHNLRRIERNQELAYTDPLTGMANSRCLVRHLERMTRVGTRDEGHFSVVMLDLDGFKQVNDAMGHLRGDELLRQVAETLARVARAGDIVCRYAGDEFLMLMPKGSRAQAELVAERVREAIEAISLVDGRVRIGASLGVATFPDDGADGKALINAADRRMYEDKFERRRRRRLERSAGEMELAGIR